MKYENDAWSKPKIADFVKSEYCYENPFFSANGNRIYFSASQVDQKIISSDIWFVDRTSSGWSEQKKLGSPPNSDNFDAQPSLSNDGSLYFISYYEKADPQYGLYYSRYSHGQYSSSVLMDEKFNRLHADWTPYIAPDESYFIFCSFRDGGFGSGDLYIAFKLSDGTWSEVVNMGEKINAAAQPGEANPVDSMDDLYFLTGKFDLAKAKYERALAIRPQFLSAWKLGYICALDGEYD